MGTAAIGSGGLCGRASPTTAGRQAEAARAVVGLVGWQPASLHSNCSSVTSLHTCGTLGKVYPACLGSLAVKWEDNGTHLTGLVRAFN